MPMCSEERLDVLESRILTFLNSYQRGDRQNLKEGILRKGGEGRGILNLPFYGCRNFHLTSRGGVVQYREKPNHNTKKRRKEDTWSRIEGLQRSARRDVSLIAGILKMTRLKKE